jgi:hypothetical protein
MYRLHDDGDTLGLKGGLEQVGDLARHPFAAQLASELGPDRVVVTIAVDSGLKYLAGDLFS